MMLQKPFAIVPPAQVNEAASIRELRVLLTHMGSHSHAQIDLVLGGNLGGRKNPSVIRDLASGKVVRPD